MMSKKLIGTGLIALALTLGITGCANDGSPSMLPNPDPNLRKTSAELAADAAKRNYESDALRGGDAQARGEYELMTRRIDLVNLSTADWTNVEVWINHDYVLLVPALQKDMDEKLDFEMFFDRDGHHFDTDGGKNPLQAIEIFHDGKMYDVKATPD